MSLQADLNRLAGTTGRDAQGAAQVWANRPGLDLLGCLNHKNGSVGLGLVAVCNALAGTSYLGVDAAAARIPSGPPAMRIAYVGVPVA